MADTPRPKPPFTIRRLDPVQPARPSARAGSHSSTPPIAPSDPTPPANDPTPPATPPSTPPPPKPEPEPEPEAAAELTGARFRSATAVLSYLGSVAGSGLAREGVVRRSPDGLWWAEVSVAPASVASLVLTGGGTPFVRSGKRWVPVDSSGLLPDAKRGQKLDISRWQSLDLLDLLAAAHLHPGRYFPSESLDLVVPGPLGRWVLRRAAALALEIGIIPAMRRPLAGGAESGALRMRLRATRGTVPAAFVRALCNLPYVVAGVTTGGSEGDLLVDVRVRTPIAAGLLASMLPAGETWVLGPPDVGHCRVRHVGAQLDGATLLDTPEIAVADAPPMLPADLPKRIPVRVVARADAAAVDAVLLDDTELAWLRSLLMGRPITEAAFLIPGAGAHLLLAPGGLPGQVPFGRPLTRIGPGALYIELGCAFYPPLPAAARIQQFGVSTQTAVAVSSGGTAFRFQMDHLLPCWSLFVGEAPTVRGGLSTEGSRILAAISEIVRRREIDQSQPLIGLRSGRKPIDAADVPGLLEEAAKEEARGNLLHAAELLEEAGLLGRAGRLYERAAGSG